MCDACEDDLPPDTDIQLPRLENWLRTTYYTIRCGCWKCHVPFLRKWHWRHLVEKVEAQ
jgi:hypothetical protein